MKDLMYEYNPNFLTADGFDEAIIGIVDGFDQNPVILYDQDKCIDILAKDMPREEAVEYFNFNVMGSYVGKNTPKFAVLFNNYKNKEESK